MCCTSLRGAAYFGASIHITLGAVLFIRYVIVTAFLTFFNVTDVIKDRITGILLPFVAYITLFLAFGIVIFHSVEKEYFIILKWATLGFSLLQLVVLIALYTLRFLPAYDYQEYPFLPVSITDGYVNSGFQTDDAGHAGGLPSGDHLPEDYSSEFLPKLTRSPGGAYPTSSTGGNSSSRSSSFSGKSTSAERESDSDLNFIHPVPAATPPNKWLGEVYSLIALIVMTVVSLVYLTLLFIYVRQLIYEDSGHVFGHAQSVTRNVAFYVQPQFAQSGNSDNKLTNSPSPALRSQALHSSQSQLVTSNCTQPVSNTQIPNEFLPQPHNQTVHQQQRHPSNYHQTQNIGNHMKPGTNVDTNVTHLKDQALQQQQQSSQSQAQSQNHIIQRSPVPPARTVQQNIQTQQQQQVITIYPQKGGGYTSSSSSPRMQVKFAKPLEQHPNSGGALTQTQTHIHCGEQMVPPEPPRSCLANPASVQCNPPPLPPHQPVHMMHPQPQCQRMDPGRNLCHIPGQFQQASQQQMQSPCGGNTVPLPPMHQQGQQQCFPSSSHIQGQQGPPYTHQHQQPPQHMPYHGKSRAQQQSYNDMVDNSSYLVFSGNPNTSNLASASMHPSHMTSASHTYPHCSQRRPSGSMV